MRFHKFEDRKTEKNSVNQTTYFIKIIKLILNIAEEGRIINERKKNHHW